MKVALIEVPYPCRLAIPLERLGALELSYLVKQEGYVGGQTFTVAEPAERFEIKVVDTSEIQPYEPPQPHPSTNDERTLPADDGVSPL